LYIVYIQSSISAMYSAVCSQVVQRVHSMYIISITYPCWGRVLFRGTTVTRIENVTLRKTNWWHWSDKWNSSKTM